MLRIIHIGCLVLLVNCLIPIAVQPAVASPITGETEETILYTPGQTLAARGLGLYRSAETGLFLETPDPNRIVNYWLPTESGHLVDDGVVKAHFTLGRRPDVTVLLRASADAVEPEQINGIGVSIERNYLVLYRYKDGMAHSLSSRKKIKNLDKGRQVELVVFLVGPFVTAQLYDAMTLDLLGTVTGYDEGTDREGHAGLRTHSKSDHKTVLTRMTYIPALQPAASRDSIFGRQRFIELSTSQHHLLSEYDAKKVIHRGSQEDVEWLVTNQKGLERLKRRGIEPISITGDVPFWATNKEYREMMDRGPTESERGYHLDKSYKDTEMVHDIVESYHRKYPSITSLHTIGTTHQGRPIIALRITDNPNENEGEPTVLLNGAHHGGELLSTEYALDSMRIMLEGYGRDERVTGWINKLDIWLVPLVNPDGNWIFMQQSNVFSRKNGRDNNEDGTYDYADGVDLNRNYPFKWGSSGEKASRSWAFHYRYRGPGPASEPEVAAMMALADQQHFAASISWHTSSTKVLTPYTIDGVENLQPDVPSLLIAPIVEQLPTQPNRRKFKLVRKLYSVEGVDQDWFFHTHGTFAYLLEGSHHNPSKWSTALKSIEGARPFFELLLDRIVSGPLVVGQTVDVSGNPVPAIVTIDEVMMFEGEEWTSRESDGHFTRLFHEPGQYTVRATYGTTSAVQTVEVRKKGWTKVRLVLE